MKAILNKSNFLGSLIIFSAFLVLFNSASQLKVQNADHKKHSVNLKCLGNQGCVNVLAGRNKRNIETPADETILPGPDDFEGEEPPLTDDMSVINSEAEANKTQTEANAALATNDDNSAPQTNEPEETIEPESPNELEPENSPEPEIQETPNEENNENESTAAQTSTTISTETKAQEEHSSPNAANDKSTEAELKTTPTEASSTADSNQNSENQIPTVDESIFTQSATIETSTHTAEKVDTEHAEETTTEEITTPTTTSTTTTTTATTTTTTTTTTKVTTTSEAVTTPDTSRMYTPQPLPRSTFRYNYPAYQSYNSNYSTVSNDQSFSNANCPGMHCEFGYKTDLYGKPICSCFNPCVEKKCGSNVCKIEKLTDDKFIGVCYDANKIERPKKCHETMAPGNCRDYSSRYYYNSFQQRCVHFIYTGCNGNGNNFPSWEKCHMECNTCSQPPAKGNCQGNLIRYYYNHVRRTCEPFSYSGCKGNENNFYSRKQCEDSCIVRREGALFLNGNPIVKIYKYHNLNTDKLNEESKTKEHINN